MPDLNNEFGLDIHPNLDKSSVRRTENDARKLAVSLRKMLSMVGITLSAAGLISFAKQAAAVAAEVEKTKKKINAAFSEIDSAGRRTSDLASRRVTAWSQVMSDKLGKSSQDLQSYTLQFSDLLEELKLTKDASAGFSMALTETAMNLAAFNGMTDAEAVSTLTSAIQGSESAARDLNVTLDDTRLKEAMLQMGLKGTFNALDEGQKAAVRYNAIVAQSQGALEGIGAAAQALEDGDYVAWQQNLNAQIKDFKAMVGQYILPYITEFMKLGVKILDGFKKGLKGLTDVNKQTEKAKKLFEGIRRVLSFVVTTGGRFISMLGGAKNALKLLAAVIGIFYAMKVVDKAKKLWENVGGLTGALKKLGGTAKNFLPLLAVFLLIEDFVNFMLGNPSVIGDVFNAAGIDSDAVRAKVQEVVDIISGKLNEIKTFIDDHISDVGSAVATIMLIAVPILAAIAIFGGLSSAVSGVIGIISGTGGLISILSGLSGPFLIIAALAGVLAWAIYSNWDSIKDWTKDMVDSVIEKFGEWNAKLNDFFKSLGDLKKNVENVAKEVDDAITDATTAPERKHTYQSDIPGVTPGDEFYEDYWNNIWPYQNGGLRQPVDHGANQLQKDRYASQYANERTFSGHGSDWLFAEPDLQDDRFFGEGDNIYTAEPEFVAAEPEFVAAHGISSMLSVTGSNDWMRNSGGEVSKEYAAGINDGLSEVETAAEAVGQITSDYIEHNSPPKKGPMSDDDEWGGRFIDMLIEGIDKGLPRLGAKLTEVAEMFAAVANFSGVQMMAGAGGIMPTSFGGMSRNSSIIQNISFNNSFTGTDRQNMVTASRQLGKSANDASHYLANAMSMGV